VPAAQLLHTRAPPASDQLIALTDSGFGARGRLTNISTMSAEARGEKLPAQAMRAEYLVHGEFNAKRPKRSRAGAYWVPLPKMLKDVGRESVELEIDIFNGAAEIALKDELSEEEEESESEEGERRAAAASHLIARYPTIS